MFRIKAANAGYDDLDGMTLAQAGLLASRGVVFCTSYTKDGKAFGGNIVAASEADAERIVSERGLGEKIIGQLASVE